MIANFTEKLDNLSEVLLTPRVLLSIFGALFLLVALIITAIIIAVGRMGYSGDALIAVDNSVISEGVRVTLQPSAYTDLVETSEFGPLPIRADGFKPAWRAYARPFDYRDSRPRIGVLLRDAAYSRDRFLETLAALPGPVGVVLSAYEPDLGTLAARARLDGHEVYLDIPMETLFFPNLDPGPLVLTVENSREENLAVLYSILGRTQAYSGVVNFMGSRLINTRVAFYPIVQDLANRGLAFVETPVHRMSMGETLAQEYGLPYTKVDLALEDVLGKAPLLKAFTHVEKLATEQGAALLLLRANTLVLNQLQDWAASFPDKGLVMAPVTAMMQVP